MLLKMLGEGSGRVREGVRGGVVLSEYIKEERWEVLCTLRNHLSLRFVK